LTPSFTKQIIALWNEKPIQDAFLHKSELPQIPDNVEYFISRLDDISKPDFVPTLADYLRVRERTSGYYTERIKTSLPNHGDFTFEFTDVGGQRSERKKWMKVIHEDIHAVLFVFAISEYDKKCYEDNQTYRIHEALNLFEDVIEKNFFQDKSAIVFLNKYDLFCDKIKQAPITISFPNFPNDKNPNDAQDVVDFVMEQFRIVEQKHANSNISTHMHLTTALDTDRINKLFIDITMDLVQNNMKSMML